MASYLSLHDPRFFKQHYYATGKPYDPEYLFLLYRYPELTSYYFDLLTGLCLSREFLDLLSFSSKTPPENLDATLWNDVESLYRDIEQSDLTKRSKYPFFSEDEIREIDKAVEDAGISREQTVRRLVNDLDRDSTLVTLSSLQTLFFFYCVRPSYQAEERQIGHEFTIRDTGAPERKQKKRQSNFTSLSPEQRETFDALIAEQDEKTPDSEKGFTSVANPLDFAPNLRTIPVEIAKLCSLLVFAGWWMAADNTTKNPFSKPARIPFNTQGRITANPSSWDVNEPLAISQAQLIDYKEKKAVTPFHKLQGSAIPFFDIDFGDLEVNRFKRLPPEFATLYLRKLKTTGAEHREQTLRDKTKLLHDQFGYLRILKATELEDNEMGQERISFLADKEELSMLDKEQLDLIYSTCIDQVKLTPLLPQASNASPTELETMFLKIGTATYEVEPKTVQNIFDFFLTNYKKNLGSSFQQEGDKKTIWGFTKDFTVFFNYLTDLPLCKTTPKDLNVVKSNDYLGFTNSVFSELMRYNAKYLALLTEKGDKEKLSKEKLQRFSLLLTDEEQDVLQNFLDQTNTERNDFATDSDELFELDETNASITKWNYQGLDSKGVVVSEEEHEDYLYAYDNLEFLPLHEQDAIEALAQTNDKKEKYFTHLMAQTSKASTVSGPQTKFLLHVNKLWGTFLYDALKEDYSGNTQQAVEELPERENISVDLNTKQWETIVDNFISTDLEFLFSCHESLEGNETQNLFEEETYVSPQMEKENSTVDPDDLVTKKDLDKLHNTVNQTPTPGIGLDSTTFTILNAIESLPLQNFTPESESGQVDTRKILNQPFSSSHLFPYVLTSTKFPLDSRREVEFEKPLQDLTNRQKEAFKTRFENFDYFIGSLEVLKEKTSQSNLSETKGQRVGPNNKNRRNELLQSNLMEGNVVNQIPNVHQQDLAYQYFKLLEDSRSLTTNTNYFKSLLVHSILSTRGNLDSRTVWALNLSYEADYRYGQLAKPFYYTPNQPTYRIFPTSKEVETTLKAVTKEFSIPLALTRFWPRPTHLNQTPRFEASQTGIVSNNFIDFRSSNLFNSIFEQDSTQSVTKKFTSLGFDRFQHFEDTIYPRRLGKAGQTLDTYTFNFDNWVTNGHSNVQTGLSRKLSVSTGFMVRTTGSSTGLNTRLLNTEKQNQTSFVPETIWNWETRTRQFPKHLTVNGTVNKLTPQLKKKAKILEGEYSIEPQLAFPFIDNYLSETNELLFDRDVAGTLCNNDSTYRPYSAAESLQLSDLTKPFNTAEVGTRFNYAKQKRYVPFLSGYPTNDFFFYDKNFPEKQWATKIDSGYRPIKPVYRYLRHIASQVYRLPVLSWFGTPSRYYSESVGTFEREQYDAELTSYSFAEMLEESFFLWEELTRMPYSWFDDEVYDLEDESENELIDGIVNHFFNSTTKPSDPLAKRVLEYGMRYDMERGSYIREETKLPLISQVTRRPAQAPDLVTQNLPEALGTATKTSFEPQRLTTENLSTVNSKDLHTRQRTRRTDENRLTQSLVSAEWYRKDLPPHHTSSGFSGFIKGVALEPLFYNWQRGELRALRFGRDFWVDWPLIRSEELDEITLEPAAWSDFRFFGCNSGITALLRLLCNPIAIEAHLHPLIFLGWLSQLVFLGVLLGILTLSIQYCLSPDITGNEEERKRLHQNHPYFGYELKGFRQFIGASELFDQNHPTSVGIQYVRPEDNDIGFIDVADTVDIYGDVFTDIMNYFNDQLDFYDEDIHRDKSFFFIGRKGTGKRTAAQAIAKEINGPLFTVSARDFTRIPHMSVIECIRYIFELADLQSPCVMYVTDFEYIGLSRAYTLNKRMAKVINVPGGPEMDGGVARDELYQFERAEAKRASATIRSVSADVAQQEKVIMTLLIEYDLLYKYNYPFLMIGSSTKPKNFDLALMRPGRLGRILSFGVLTPRGRARIISANSGGFTFDNHIDWYRVMAETTGHFGHEIVSMCHSSVGNVRSLNNIAHTEGTLEVAGLLATIATYQELGKKSEAQVAVDYELDANPSPEDNDPNKIPEEFYYFLRHFEYPTARQKRDEIQKDTKFYPLETMRNAYYQAARFFVFKWLDDPIDFRSMRFLNRQIEETIDHLRIKNTFMPWGETKVAMGLNYLLYIISGLAGETLYMKGRFPIGLTRLDRETDYRKKDLKAYDSYIDEFYLNFDTFRENFKKDQSLYFLYADVPHHNAGAGMKHYQTEGFHELSKALKTSLTSYDPLIPRNKLPQKEDPSLLFNIRRNQLARRLKVWDDANPLTDIYQHYGGFYRPLINTPKEEAMLSAWKFIFHRSADYWQNYTGLVQTSYPQGPKEVLWRRDSRMQGLIVATSFLQMVRPLVDFVAYALAQEGSISHSFLRGIIEPEFIYEFNVKESRLEPALTQQIPKSSIRIQETPYAFTFVTAKNVSSVHYTYRIRNVKKVETD